MYNGFRGWLIDDRVIQAAAGTFPLVQTQGGEVVYDVTAYLYVPYDEVTYEPQVTPLPYDANWNALPLTKGSTVPFSATVYYVNPDGTGTNIKFVFKDGSYNTLGTAFGSATATTTSTEQSATVSGTVAVPDATEGYAHLWIQMLDASGSIVTETYVTSYAIQ